MQYVFENESKVAALQIILVASLALVEHISVDQRAAVERETTDGTGKRRFRRGT